MEETKELARFVVETELKEIPEKALAVAKDAVLDTIGVMLAGLVEPSAQMIRDFVHELGGEPRAGVVGGGFKTSAANAALANGTMGHALDYDDVSPPTQGHPSACLVPTILALGEEIGASGKEVLAAYVLGFEAWSKVGLAVPALHVRGWHPTGVLGTLGAAAAAARLLGLDGEQAAMALGIAGSQACGLAQNFGRMTKPFHAGNAARSGIVAAMLAKKGFSAAQDILEGNLGFAVAYAGQGNYDLSKVLEKPEQRYYILSQGIYVKKYPTCYLTHRAIDAILYLRHEYNIAADDVESVEVLTSHLTIKEVFYTQPKTALEGKFSMQFAMASALVDGWVGLKQVVDDKVRDPRTRALMEKVVMRPHPDYKGDEGAEVLMGRPDVVKVRLKNGKEYSREVLQPTGTPQAPLSREELHKKYRDCASLALEDKDINCLLELIEGLEQLTTIQGIMDILISNR